MNASVLIVEDDDTIRRLLVEYLEQHSELQVAGARDGVDALHAISTRPYGVVVLDMMMPHMSGVDFLDSLSVLTFDPTVRAITLPPAVIVITSAAQEDIPAGAIEQRFPDFVRCVHRKPLAMAELAECVASELRKQR